MKSIFTLILLSLSCCHLHAKSMAENDDKAQIEQVFAQYMQGYNHYLNTKVMHKKQSIYTDAMMLIAPNRAPAILNKEKLAVGVQGFLDGLYAKGVRKIVWKKLQIQLLSSTVAIASNAAIRYKGNGDIHDHAGATYMLTKNEQHWKIAAFTPHAAKNVLMLN